MVQAKTEWPWPNSRIECLALLEALGGVIESTPIEDSIVLPMWAMTVTAVRV